MEILTAELKKLIKRLPDGVASKLSDETLNRLYDVYPFNKFELIISYLLSGGVITHADYLDIRNKYISRNKYLYLFEITAPRSFGETWAQRHLNEIVPELERPSSALDNDYSGQYDFWYDGIRIEVKASRAVEKKSGGTLVSKALSSGSKKSFNMNFQQIKPGCCDVFVWIGVWKDCIRYWVLSSEEVKTHPAFSPGQHRGNVGEGQLWITDKNISEFTEYEVAVRNLFDKIKQKAGRD